ncbi:MAG: hypothetical protein A2W91_07060 [Bacteroidetes bacterium GWF2_38_335]|nr:MAG: hypothetical protein A2W91_07060 [Bacteroidetes bacterium GWF2_38_335]OFY77087.1 MAG: hypothetical protein A2281_14295 [Bacteroidetes bacterium RIFOXYA12_FULL_38_20]HBS84977.1 methyltransferase type 12 [Bacteroidales bacterium]
MLEYFPKTRNELPEAYQKIYAEHYKKNREGQTSASSMSQKLERWLHRKVAADLKGRNNLATLEIGAGTLNQLKYENTRPYDIIEPFSKLFAGSEFLNRINAIYTDISEIPSDKKYDRITSIATFEHITNLPEVVAKTCLLLNEGGTLRVSIPNEGTILWKMGWKFTTGIEFKHKYGLDYGVLMRYEHVNTAREIEEVLKFFYSKAKCSCFGISRGLALYRYYECSAPKVSVATDWLKKV